MSFRIAELSLSPLSLPVRELMQGCDHAAADLSLAVARLRLGETEEKGDDGEGEAVFLEKKNGTKQRGKDECASRRQRKQLKRGEEDGGERNNLSMRENEERVQNKSAAVKVKEQKPVYP